MLDFFKNFITVDLVIVIILGVTIFYVEPDLQAQIVAGFIGYIGGKFNYTLK